MKNGLAIGHWQARFCIRNTGQLRRENVGLTAGEHLPLKIRWKYGFGAFWISEL